MPDVIIKLKIDDKEYDAKLVNADRQLAKLRSTAEGNANDFQKYLTGIASSALAGISAMKLIVDSVKAFAEEELVQKELEAQLGRTSQALLDQAAALQKVTTYADDQIVAAQTMISAFTKNDDAIKALTLSAVDFATHSGMNLTSAAQLISKTFGSSTNALQRHGIQVTGVAGSSERLASITSNVAKIVGGQAVAAANTFSGRLQQMRNRLGDVQEKIGKEVVQVFEALSGAVNNTVKSIEDSEGSFTVIGGILKTAATAGMVLWTTLQMIGNSLGTIGASVAKLITLDFNGFFKTSAMGGKKIVDDLTNNADMIINMWRGVDDQINKAISNVVKNSPVLTDLNNQEKISELELLKIRQELGELSLQQYRDLLKKRIETLKSNTPEEKQILLQWKQELKKATDDLMQAEIMVPFPFKLVNADAEVSDDTYDKIKQDIIDQQYLKADAMADGIERERALLDAWYAEQKVKYEGRTQELKSIDEKYTRSKKELDEQDAANKRHIYGQTAAFIAGAFAQSTAVGKAASIAQAYINTYEAATKALTAGPVIGEILAGLVIAAGMANIAKIVAVKTPSVKGYERGGGVLVGEKSPEIIAPVDSYAEASRMLVERSVEAVQNYFKNGNSNNFADNSFNMRSLTDLFKSQNERIEAWQREFTFRFKPREIVAGMAKANAKYNRMKF